LGWHDWDSAVGGWRGHCVGRAQCLEKGVVMTKMRPDCAVSPATVANDWVQLGELLNKITYLGIPAIQ
jgi:hypothetical protein